MQQNLLKGVLIMLLTVLIWGALFPIAKGALIALDAFWMSSVRYGCAALMFVAILVWREGAAALRYQGKLLQASFYGVMGFTGFSILVFVGLAHTAPEHGAIIMALQTPMTAFAHWALRGSRPAGFTLVCVALAILGVFMVIGKGDLAHMFDAGTLFGDALILLGAMSWVVYTIGAVSFPGWSVLRFTTLTCLPGTAGIFVVTAIATAAGEVQVPSFATLVSIGWELTYMAVFTAVVAVLCWNAAIGYLGALNAMLLANLVPVVTFVIRILQGHRFQAIELAGVTLVVLALAANNLYMRRRGAPAARKS